MSSTISIDKIKVAVVASTPVSRKLLARILDRDQEISSVSVLQKLDSLISLIEQYKPDVVVLDTDVKEKNISDVIKRIKTLYSRLPIIILCGHAKESNKSLAMYLCLGVNDYVIKKPESSGSVGLIETINKHLLPKIISLGKRQKFRSTQKYSNEKVGSSETLINSSGNLTEHFENANKPTSAGKSLPNREVIKQPVRAVCIGVSTGGPSILMNIFTQFKSTLAVPIFIVQHMPSNFTKSLAERLSKAGSVRVFEARDGEQVKSGYAYLAPGGLHMELKRVGTRVEIVLTSNPPENSCRPSVDVLFRSAAAIYGKDLLAVVFSGMCTDGLKGCEKVSSRYGQIIAQDEPSSVVWGMPGAIINNNLADLILPGSMIADEILFRARKITT